jgi:hypothetical protein
MSVHKSAKFQQCSVIFAKSAVDTKILLIFLYCALFLWTLYSRVDSESRFAIFLTRIMWKMRLASRENISASLASLTSLVSLTSLARREKCDKM